MDIYSLNKLSKTDLNKAGKKAAFLGELNKEFNVPEGFVISTSIFEKFLELTKLKHQIAELLKGVNPNKYDFVQSRANKIQELIVKSHVPDEIKEEIIEFYDSLDVSTHNVDKLDFNKDDSKNLEHSDNSDLIDSNKEIFVAVRTSAVCYLASRVHINFFNIIGKEKLISAVKLCWASLFTAKAVYHYIEHDIKEISMAVLVQRMLIPSVSGRIDTISNKSKKEMVVEACLGLGEAISSGLVLPDRYLINKDSLEITKYRVNNQSVKLICDPDSEKTIRMGVSNENADKQKLDDNLVVLVAKQAKKIEKLFAQPMRIEFAFEKGKLYILKALPISEEFLPQDNAQEIVEESTSEKFEDELVEEQDAIEQAHDTIESEQTVSEPEHDIIEATHDTTETTHDTIEQVHDTIESEQIVSEPEHDIIEQTHDAIETTHDTIESEQIVSEPEHDVIEQTHDTIEQVHDTTESEQIVSEPEHDVIEATHDTIESEQVHIEENQYSELNANDKQFIQKEAEEELMMTPDDFTDYNEKNDVENSSDYENIGSSNPTEDELVANGFEEIDEQFIEESFDEPTDESTDEPTHEPTHEHINEPTSSIDEEPKKVSYPNFSHELSEEEHDILNNLPGDIEEDVVYVEKDGNENHQYEINEMLDVEENNIHKEADIDYDDNDHNEMMQNLEKIGLEDDDTNIHLSKQEEINYELEGDLTHKSNNTRSNNISSEIYEEDIPHEELPHQQEINKEINQAINQQHEVLVEEEQPIYEDEPTYTEEIELKPDNVAEYETDDQITDSEDGSHEWTYNDEEENKENKNYSDDNEEGNHEYSFDDEEIKDDENTY